MTPFLRCTYPRKEKQATENDSTSNKNLFSVFCCFNSEEDSKYGAFLLSSDNQVEEATKHVNDGTRIRMLEDQIMYFNKSRVDRGRILTKPLDLGKQVCDYSPPVFEKSSEDLDFIVSNLRDKNFLFTESTEDELRTLANAMKPEKVECGKMIIKQGDCGDFFYLVHSGEVEFVQDGKPVGTCHPGGSFGELALLYNSPRAVSCIAACPSGGETTLWKVDHMTFRCIVAHNTYKQNSKLKNHLVCKMELFQNLSESAVCRFVSAMTRVQFKSGDLIVQKGQKGNVFYIIADGKVKVHDMGLGDSQFEDQILEVGDHFGEQSLLTGEVRSANVTALTDVTVMAMDRITFEKHMGPLQKLLNRNLRKTVLKSLPLIFNSDLTDPELELLVDLMTEVCYHKGDLLAEAGKPYDMTLWIIKHGSLFVYSSKDPDRFYKLQVGDYFGDKSIRGDRSHIGSYTAVCEENLTTWALTRDDIESVIGDVKRLGSSLGFRKSRQGVSVLSTDLKKHRILGRGGFGTVWLVSHKKTKTTYALKSISKKLLIEQQQVHSAVREKELLCKLDHPFILHLVASYQDANNLYLLLPIITGGELYSVVEKARLKGGRGLPTHDAAFYAACIIEALGHFHQRQIAYRDLKLENVLLDQDGYCVIIDLGFAKIVTDKTFTLVGTPEYIAPEVIMAKGHDKAVDYWAYGVLLYELLAGYSPFFSNVDAGNNMAMFKRIVLVDYSMPSHFDETTKAFISELLRRVASQRLGNLANGYLDIKKHQWFTSAGVKPNEIATKNTAAPWKPVVKNAFKLAETFGSHKENFNDNNHGSRLTAEEEALFFGF